MLSIARHLLTTSPWAAQLLGGMARTVNPGPLPFRLYWEERSLILSYPPNWEEEYTVQEWSDWWQEELLHFILGHPAQVATASKQELAHLAADLEVAFWLSEEAPLHELYATAWSRLQLPLRSTWSTLYARLEALQLALGRDFSTIFPSYIATRNSHAYWPKKMPILGYQLWWQQQHVNLPSSVAALLPLPEVASHGKVPWSQLLRRFIYSQRARSSRTSLLRPSKRYPTNPGRRRKRQPHLLVAVDTSGSMEATTLRQVFTELQVLHQQGIAFSIVQADDQVRQLDVYKGKPSTGVSGRGGTNYDPVIRLANQQGSYDGLIYITDGHGPRPTVESGTPLLWLLTEKLPAKKEWLGSVVEIC